MTHHWCFGYYNIRCNISKEPQAPQSKGSCLILKEFPAASLENVADGNEMHLTDTSHFSEDENHFQEGVQSFASLCWKDNSSKHLWCKTCKSTYHQDTYSDHDLEYVVAIGAWQCGALFYSKS